MSSMVLEKLYSFNVIYDFVSLVDEDVSTESSLALAMRLPLAIIGACVSFTMAEGLVRTDHSEMKFRTTALGRSFLREFQGMKKFLS